MTVSLSLLELAERVMSGSVPKLTGAGRESLSYWSGCVSLSLLELAERVMSGCEWSCREGS